MRNAVQYEATVCVVQESMRWKSNQIRDSNSPVRLLSDMSNFANCFPVLYPTGGPTFHDRRKVRITLSRYLNARILNADGCFARSTGECTHLFCTEALIRESSVQI